jgi:hypothetical protein
MRTISLDLRELERVRPAEAHVPACINSNMCGSPGLTRLGTDPFTNLCNLAGPDRK